MHYEDFGWVYTNITYPSTPPTQSQAVKSEQLYYSMIQQVQWQIRPHTVYHQRLSHVSISIQGHGEHNNTNHLANPTLSRPLIPPPHQT